ncbi:hypothetical protein EJB05_38428, partial [Eragrostis curvula]
MESVAVVVVPFPAQGHLNQLLHLSLQLASRGLPVHYAAPAEHVRQARARVHGWGDDALRCVHFHELAISAYATPPPDPAADSPFPSHLMPLWEAYITDAPAQLAALLEGLSAAHRRVVLVYDRMNGFAAEEAARLPNGEAFGLHCLAASTLAGKMDTGLRLMLGRGLTFRAVDEYATEEFMEYVKRALPHKEISPGAGILVNTCRALEGEFIDVVVDHLAADGKKLFVLVCKYLKAGMLVRPWEKHNEVIPAAAIQKVIEDAMHSEEGRAVRKRAKVLGESVRASRVDGGSSRKDLDDFIAYVTR